VLKILSNVQLGIAIASLVVVIAINFLEICMRYFFDISLVWIQDYSLLLMVWMIFMGASVIAYEKRDVTITILTDYLPNRINKHLDFIISAIVMLFFAILGKYCTTLLMKQGTQTTVTAMLPLKYFTLAVVVNCFYTMVVYLRNVVAYVLKCIRKEPEQ
jgi:TRAP-type C4-dicarboxylate transport system permease small subunit